MRRKITYPHRRKLYPSNVPKRLFQLFRSHGYIVTALANHLGVNSGHVSRLLIDGIEPNDTTEAGMEARKKLFLPKRKKKIKKEVNRTIEKEPAYITKWKHLPTDERRKAIQQYIGYKERQKFFEE